VVSVVPGKRTVENVEALVQDFKERTEGRPMNLITSDEYKPYRGAILKAYGEEIVPQRTGKPGRPKAPSYEPSPDLRYATVHKTREKGRVVKIDFRVVFGTVAAVMAALKLSKVSHKKITNDQAALTGHPGRWTSKDLRRAWMLRNRLGRPWGHRGLTPEEAWQRRKPITPPQRSQLQTTVDRYRQEERTKKGIPDEAVLGNAAQASVDRVAISRALQQHGYLRVTRRLVTPPIKPGGAARFP
jgi:hypothetical protein